MARAGLIAASPRRRRYAALSAVVIPPPSHGPHASDAAGSPAARRQAARASRNAFAAAYPPCRPLPQVAAIEENRTNCSRPAPAVSSCKCAAPAALAASTSPSPATLACSSGVSWTRPAACSTPHSGGPAAPAQASTAAACPRLPASAASTLTADPDPASPAASPAAPAAAGPDRDASTTCGQPRPASHRAACPPIAPVPPVISTLPCGSHRRPGPAGPPARTSRRAQIPLPRTATWSSPHPASTAHNPAPARSPSTAGISTSPPHRSGYSSAATRPSPHTCACTGLATASPGTAATAPHVTAHNRAPIPASPSACTSNCVPATPAATPPSNPAATPSSDTTPATPPPPPPSPPSSLSLPLPSLL